MWIFNDAEHGCKHSQVRRIGANPKYKVVCFLDVFIWACGHHGCAPVPDVGLEIFFTCQAHGAVEDKVTISVCTLCS
jgi:hypothetical protein